MYSWWVSFLISGFAFLSSANAIDAFYVGGFAGVANTDLSGFGTRLTYGLRGGVRLGEKLTSGLFYQVYSTKVSDSTGSADIYVVPVLVELNFHLWKATDGPFASLKMGGIRHSAENVTSGYTPPINSSNDFSIGVGGGYNLEILPGSSAYLQFDTYSIDSKSRSYSFFSLVAGYTFEL